MTDRPLYKELRRVFLDSWSDSNGWASLLRMIADRRSTAASRSAARTPIGQGDGPDPRAAGFGLITHRPRATGASS